MPALPKNSVIIMDNASFHKSDKTRRIIEQWGHRLLFLPAYSPDLNPIRIVAPE
jgi:transposase